MKLNKTLILASASPRRRELLAMAGFPFVLRTSDADEHTEEHDPGRRVCLLARRKAEAAWQGDPDEAVLGADTMVWLEGRLLGKPEDAGQAREMLRALSGRVHTVYTGLCLRTEKGAAEAVCATKVWFRPLTETEIEQYIATGESMDKAGAYGIQGRGALLVQRIDGDFYNVVGLPLATMAELLRKEGVMCAEGAERD